MFWKRALAVGLSLLVAGCQLPRGVTSVPSNPQQTVAAAAPARGQVGDFPTRGGQALPVDVMNASTISLIDSVSGKTLWSTVTDSAGAFSLTYALPAASASATVPYYLEAVHGLGSNLPGNDLGRFRTVLQWNGAGWLSCTNAAVGGTILINQYTTALAIEKGLDNAIPLSNLINKVSTANPSALNANPAVVGHSNTEINNLAAEVLTSLSANFDPVASVPQIAPSFSAFLPTSGPPATLVVITGKGFSPSTSGNTVTFSGVGSTAPVLLATIDKLVVAVPDGAQSGPIKVITARGQVASSAGFTITSSSASGPSIDMVSPSTGRVGTVVTLTGSFGTGTATPDVYFSAPANYPAAQADVTAWNSTSITCSVPLGSAAGPVTVQIGRYSTTSADWFDLLTGELSLFGSGTQTTCGYYYTTPWNQYGYANATASVGGRLYYYQIGGTSDGAQVVCYPVSPDTGNITRWRTCSRLVTGRSDATAVVLNGWLYVFGGYSTTYLGDVECAKINSDGSLGPWAAINTLATPRRYPCAVVRTATNYIYVMGGNNGAYLNTWEMWSQTNPSTGAISRTNTGTIMNGAVAINSCFGRAVLSGSGILLHLGYTTGYVTVTLNIPISAADDTLLAGTPVTAPTYCHAYGGMAIVGPDVYLFGGQGGAYVEHATFNFADATITGSWTNAAMNVNFTNPTYQGMPLVTPNNVVWLTGNSLAAQIECAYVEPDKSIKYWHYWGQTRHGWYGSAWYTVGRNIWRLTGYDVTKSVYDNSTEYYSVEDDGTIGPAISGPNTTYQRDMATTQRTTHLATNYVYEIGGYGNGMYHNSVERAVINDAAGTIGANGWSLIDNAVLYRGSQFPASLIVGNYLYVFGGYDGSPYRYVQRATIGSDGSLSDFTVLAQQLPYSSYGNQAVRIKDYVYLTTGYWNGTNYTWCFRAPVYPNGDLGAFTWCSNTQTAGYYGAYQVIGSWFYIIAAGGFTNFGQRAFIKADGTLDNWEKWQQLGNNPILLTSTYRFQNALPTYQDFLFLMSGQGAGVIIQQATIR